MKTGLALNEEVSNAPSFVKPIALYKCNECAFANTTTGALKEHKKNVHETDLPVVQADRVVAQDERQDHEEVPSTTSNVEECDPEKAAKNLPLFKCDECTL